MNLATTTTGQPTKPAPAGRWLEVEDAALTIFSEVGYPGATMKMVASRLGVQAPSLYNHVSSKQEILARILTAGIDRITDVQDAALASSSDPTEQLRAMTEAHVLFHIRHRRSAVIGDREVMHLEDPDLTYVMARRERYEGRFRETLERGAATRAFSHESSKLASFAIIEMASSVSVWFRDDGVLPDIDVSHKYGQMALRIAGYPPPGVGGPPPRR